MAVAVDLLARKRAVWRSSALNRWGSGRAGAGCHGFLLPIYIEPHSRTFQVRRQARGVARLDAAGGIAARRATLRAAVVAELGFDVVAGRGGVCRLQMAYLESGAGSSCPLVAERRLSFGLAGPRCQRVSHDSAISASAA